MRHNMGEYFFQSAEQFAEMKGNCYSFFTIIIIIVILSDQKVVYEKVIRDITMETTGISCSLQLFHNVSP